MLIAFFVNDMAKEHPNYTTTVLAFAATQRGHRVCYLTPSDFALRADDSMWVHARFAPKKKQKDHPAFFEAMAAVAEALRDGIATADDVARLQRWAGLLPGRGACGTLDGATTVAATLLTQFPQLVTGHLANDCDGCRTGAFGAERPYAVEEVPA